MTTKLTDEQFAEACRRLAAQLAEAQEPGIVDEPYWNESALTYKANELDPPAPTYADGAIAWVTNQSQHTYLCQWSDTEDNWCIGGPDGDSAPGSVTKVEPLRVLADDEIALRLRPWWPDSTSRDWRKEAEYVSAPYGTTNLPARALCLAMADAIEAAQAEAGGTK